MKRLPQRFFPFVVLALALLVIAGCSRNAKRVSTPAASIQQLAVQADGSWTVDLRLHNYSSMPMRFERVSLVASVDEHDAGTLEATPAISIGPSAADVVRLTLRPQGTARLAVADALASRRTLSYRLKGSVSATPEDASKARSFELDDSNSLNPAPGLDGVLR